LEKPILNYNLQEMVVINYQKRAFIQNENELLKQVLQMIRHRQVETTDRTLLSIQAEIICIHGDGEHALEFSQAIHQSLKQEKISIQANQAK